MSVLNVFFELPTARIAAWGGFITAENSVIPNMPKLEILNEPP